MRWRLLFLFALLPVLTPPLVGMAPPAAAEPQQARGLAPPLAERRPARLSAHGIERTDDYAWLRDSNWREVMQDPGKLSPAIRAYIDAENGYAEQVLAPLAPLRAELVAELKGRIDPADSGVPVPDGPYSYWRKYVPGAEHVQIVRRRNPDGPEEILLDGPTLAQGKPYFSFGEHRHSPDHRLYAYLVDDTGSESHTLRVRDIATGRDLPDVVTEVSDFAWADNGTLFYVRLDDDHRERFVHRHALGTDPAMDPLVYEEKDFSFSVSVTRTRTGRFVLIASSASDSTEVYLVDTARPQSEPVLIAPREHELRYYVDDWGDRLLIRTNADGAEDFKLMTAPAAAPARANWRDVVPYRQGRQIIAATPFAGFLATLEREEALPRITIYRKDDGAAHAIAFNEEAYSLGLDGGYEFDTRTIRFTYSSPTTPLRTFDYEMESRARVLRKETHIPSGHDPAAYEAHRLFVTTADNERVPITMLHRKGLVHDGTAPLFLEGYGAYAYAFPAGFDSQILSLVDRGFVYVIAHIRGGTEKGERWRNAGRRANKMNSFTDFIAVAEYLIRERYTARGRIVARGDSAGGLLMGAVANMRPDLFAGIIARVPFVDAVNTMLDDTLPLTASDFPEWGNPIEDADVYRTIAAYSPYDNVKAQAYPHMLVTAGISDPRVQYWEPLKWVAKLRALKTNDARVVLTTRMSAGHFGDAGRFAVLDEVGLIQAFALDVVGLSGR